MGANHTLNPEKQEPIMQLHEINNGRGADAAFVAADSQAAWELCMQFCERGGHLHMGPSPPGDNEHEKERGARKVDWQQAIYRHR